MSLVELMRQLAQPADEVFVRTLSLFDAELIDDPRTRESSYAAGVTVPSLVVASACCARRCLLRPFIRLLLGLIGSGA